jgi:hypothetical protein
MSSTQVISAVGLARMPQACSTTQEMERRLKRFVVHTLANLPIDAMRKDRWMREAFTRIHWLCRLAPFRLGGGSIGNTFENDLQKLIFNATAIANMADNAASSPLTNLYASLHTGDPGETGDQTTSEVTYTSYARVAVARTSGGWTVTNNSVSPVATISFPAGTGGSGTATHFAVGTASSSTGKLLFSGTITPNIVCGNGVTPQLTTASAITLD